MKLPGLYGGKRRHDTVHIRLGADECRRVAVVLGLPDQMLARAEADFEPNLLNGIGEKRSQPLVFGRLAQIEP